MFSRVTSTIAKRRVAHVASRGYASVVSTETQMPQRTPVYSDTQFEEDEHALTLGAFPSAPKMTPSPELVNEEGMLNNNVEETVLEGGFRVISTDSVSRVGSTAALYVNAGTRNETFQTQGVSHYTQRFFYGPTNRRTYLRMVVEMQKTGANIVAQNGREDMVYRIDGMRESIPKLLELVSDSVFQTRLHSNDLAPKRSAVLNDIELATQSPELILNDALHYTAFGGKTLGNSLVCPPHNVHRITNKTVTKFMNKHYTPDRMVLVGTHVNHEDLVDMAKDFFVPQFSFYAAEQAERQKEKQTDQQKKEKDDNGDYNAKASVYVGGDYQLAETRDEVVSHGVLAFQGESYKDLKAHYALAIVSEVLGNASQLYTGNLSGKTSRLYQNVLSLTPHLVSAQTFNLAYSDNGLFGVHLVTAGENSGSELGRSLQKTIDELKTIRESISENHVESAKNRVLFGLYTQLEDAVSANEFRFRNGTNSSDAHAEAIRGITKTDVQSAVSKLLASKPTLVTYGNLHNVPTTNDIRLQ